MHTALPSSQFSTLKIAFHSSQSFDAPSQGVAYDQGSSDVFFVDLLDDEIQTARPATLAGSLQALREAWSSDALNLGQGAMAWLLIIADSLPTTTTTATPQGKFSLVAYDHDTSAETRALALDDAGHCFTVTVKDGKIQTGDQPQPIAPADSVRFWVDLMERDCWSGCDEPLSVRWLDSLVVALGE